MNILYTAQVTTTGGRDNGQAVSDDQLLNVHLSKPKELGGGDAKGTNPEQLFAAGYSACFLSAMKFVADKQKLNLPESTSVTAIVGLGPIPTGFALAVELKISIPGLDKSTAESLVKSAHTVCPYSNATRGNVDVRLVVV